MAIAFELHTLMTGIMFGESPRWHEERLWFCDWVRKRSSRSISPATARPSSRSRHFRFRSTGWPMGGCWSSRRATGGCCAGSPTAGPGSLALVTPDGSARQVADDVGFPNGMVVTADNSTLILAESYANRLTAFEIAADGSLSNRRIWAALGDGVPDGICLDRENAVWYADVPNKRCVRIREGGEVLQTIELDRGCFACMLGGPQDTTLFMVAREWSGPASAADGSRTGQLLTAEAPAAGAGWP
jgi:sugar lactone lactonase YvrE